MAMLTCRSEKASLNPITKELLPTAIGIWRGGGVAWDNEAWEGVWHGAAQEGAWHGAAQEGVWQGRGHGMVQHRGT